MFNSNYGGYSLADIGAVTNGNSRNDGWGEGGAWWIIILFLFVFCGWGNNGWGNGNNGLQGALTRADLCQDMNFQGVENGVRGIQQGLCDGFYAQNTNLLNGFAGIQSTVQNGFAGVDNAICNLGFNMQQGFNTTNVALMQGQNALSTQIANCCCENRQGQADIKYQMATDTCAIQNTIQNTTRDIIDNANCNTRSILDFLVQDKIATLQTENQNLKLAASQQEQNNYLVNQLRPCPIPAYIQPNPFCNYDYFGAYRNGCGNSCSGCGY